MIDPCEVTNPFYNMNYLVILICMYMCLEFEVKLRNICIDGALLLSWLLSRLRSRYHMGLYNISYGL